MGKKGKYNQRNQEEDVKKKNFIITEQHLMDKTHMEPVEYPSFLPSDSMYPPFVFTEGQEHVLRTMLKELNYVLYLDFKNFWATILYNPTFKTCIHSCLTYFHRRWLNEYISLTPQQSQQYERLPSQYSILKDTSSYEYTKHLGRIVLLILYRIMHFQQQNTELSTLYHLKTEIIGKYILDVPRLLEIVEIYGDTNQDIVKVLIKQWTNLSTSLYGDFVDEVMGPMIGRINKVLGMVKKTTDREEFGIQYNYNRNIAGELSAGEEELKKKTKLLMEIISFYQTLKNIHNFFPTAWSQYTKFNLQINSMSENLFIEIEQAYKIWNTHNQGQQMYALMNRILKYIIDYFVEFLEKCQSMFVEKNVKSNYKEAYMKCLDRMLELYGRRQSLGKKAMAAKRYMDLYREILKVYKIDEFINKLYVQEVENSTYGLNLQYLVDFKIAIDEQLAKIHGRPAPQLQDQEQEKTEADRDEHKQVMAEEQKHKQEEVQAKNKPQKETIPEVAQLDNLEKMISKRNREQNYYEKLYKDYRTKMVIEYEDEYDDLVDYQKRPMFEDNQKEEQDSSDASSEYDAEMQQLHLVKSDSNVERARGIGAQHKNHEKYDRKNKAKFVPMRQAETKAMMNREAQKYPKQRPTYYAKQQNSRTEDRTNDRPQNSGNQGKKQYNDEECYQQCRLKNKQQKQERQRQEKETKLEPYRDDDSSDDNNDRGQPQRGRGGRGGRGGHNHDKPKGSNTNKKPKYVAKT